MKRFFRFTGVLLMVVTLSGRAGATAASRPELWFPVGEELTYKLYWGFIPVGWARVFTEWTEKDGKTLLRIRAEAKSNAVLSTIFPIDDFAESLVDPETFLPVAFIKVQNEGRFSCDEHTLFDRREKIGWLTGEQTRKGRYKRLNKMYPIDHDTRDILSFLYYLRKYSPEERENAVFRVMTGEKLYDVHVGESKKAEIKLDDYGRVPSLEYFPRAAFEQVFVHKGDMWLWVSDDPRGIIVKARAKGPVFTSVHMVLTQVDGPGEDFWVTEPN